MAIRINTNIASLNAQRNLGLSNASLNKTLERLSSGLRINRAADDAAGLAISEKMRTQVRGFTQAIANAQDAGNLIATAESGLDQTSQILQRIRELSVQSASDTLVNSDRKKIQVEVDQLLQELDKIATTTEFNTRALLDGSIQQAAAREDATFSIKSNARIGEETAIGRTIQDLLNLDDLNFDVSAYGADGKPRNAAFTFTILAGFNESNTAGTGTTAHTFAGQGGGNDLQMAAGGFVLEVRSTFQGVGPTSTTATSSILADVVNYYTLQGTGVTASATAGSSLTVDFNDTVYGNGTANYVFDGSGASLMTMVVNANATVITGADVGKSATVQINSARSAVGEDKSLTFQVGANEGQYLRMGVQDMRAQALEVEGLNLVGRNDNESRTRAQNAIGVVDKALDYVNTVRSKLGAYQNRIEYRTANLQVSRENLAASESRIRDADIAAETANLTRAQILVQAGTAVLTQANISPQSALNLL